VICAQEARWQLELDSVLLVPVGEAPHKKIEDDPGRETRYELCRLAATEEEGLAVSREEVDREGPSYTVDTLSALRDAARGNELFLIVGGDAAASLPEWREPEQLLALATVVAVGRGDADRERVWAAVAGIEGADRLRFVSMPAIGISSSLVRRRVAAGQPFRHLVPRAVAAYIEQAGLYRAERSKQEVEAKL
jgi:nicotinate-nucleotide adenylyltransferase